VTWIGSNADLSGALHKGRRSCDEAVRSDADTLVVAVEKVERLDDEVEFVALAQMNLAGDAQVGRRIVRSGESVPAVARQPVVKAVRILIGIPGNCGVHGTSSAEVHNRGEFPVIEEGSEKFVSAMKGARFGRETSDHA